MKKILFYFNCNDDNYHAGSKARNDVEEILKELNFEIKVFKLTKNIFRVIKQALSLGFQFISLSKDSIIVVNYPIIDIKYIKFNYLITIFLIFIKKIKNIKLIGIIHDIESIRNTSTKDVFLKKYDFLISHNKHMSDYLVEQGIRSDKLINLQIFDYLYKEKYTGDNFKFGNQIINAGNLTNLKNNWLVNINQVKNLTFNLFGVYLDSKIKKAENVCYFGAFSPEKIVKKLTGSFGLVWDSESLIGGIGDMANYQKYNNPHKLSLYLASGVPVIVWKQSALASFIESKHLGFAIEDIREIPKILNNMNESEYLEMKKNIQTISKKLRNGYFLKKAMMEVDKKLRNLN